MTPFATKIANQYLGGDFKISKSRNDVDSSNTEHSIHMEVILNINFEGEQDPEQVMKYLTSHINESIRSMLKDSEKNLGLDLVSVDVKPVDIQYELMSEKGESSAFEARVTPSTSISEKDEILDRIMKVEHKSVDDLKNILQSSNEFESLPVSVDQELEYDMSPSDKDDREEEFESYEESDEEESDVSYGDFDSEEDEEVDEEDEDDEDDEEDDDESDDESDYEESEDDEDEDEDGDEDYEESDSDDDY